MTDCLLLRLLTPGHMDKGFKAIPNLLTECYGSDGKPNGKTGGSSSL
jgi:hypothetical protein